MEENISVRTEQDNVSSNKIVSKKTTKDSPLTPKSSQKHFVTKSSSKKTVPTKDSPLTPKSSQNYLVTKSSSKKTMPTKTAVKESPITLKPSPKHLVTKSSSKITKPWKTAKDSPITPKSRHLQMQRQTQRDAEEIITYHN